MTNPLTILIDHICHAIYMRGARIERAKPAQTLPFDIDEHGDGIFSDWAGTWVGKDKLRDKGEEA